MQMSWNSHSRPKDVTFGSVPPQKKRKKEQSTDHEDEPPAGQDPDVEVIVGGACHDLHQQSGDGEPDAGEEHLAACHRQRYLKLGIA